MQANGHQTLITNYMYAGLLPFFAGALGPWIFADSEVLLTDLFLFYASLILVFLAGVFWTIALFNQLPNHHRHFHTAIIFSLWPLAAYLLPTLYATMLMMVGFLLLLFWEKCFINSIYTEWYKKLRHQITFIVVACHMLVIFNLIRS